MAQKMAALPVMAGTSGAYDDKGHFRKPRRIYNLLFDAAQDDVEYGKDKANGNFIHCIHSPNADGPCRNGKEEGHMVRDGLPVYGHRPVDNQRYCKRYKPL